jgi:heat shock protein HtpX
MKNQLKTILLLGALSALLVGIGGAMGGSYLYLFGAMAVLMNFVGYFWSDKIVLKMSGARELAPNEAPWLHNMVEELSYAAQIPKPRVYLIPEPQPNAFATGRNPQNGAVAVTKGIVDLLGERELRGVIAHELAHIKNRDILVSSVAATMAMAITYVAHALQFAAIFGGGRDSEERGSSGGGLLVALVAPIAATLVQLGISRSREYLADETGAHMSGDPVALASALRKLQMGAQRIPADVVPATASLFIVNPFAAGETLMNLFSTHPPMEKRIERLMAIAGQPMNVAYAS